MANLKLNLLFNILGRSSQIVITLIFTPIFLKLLGPSNYGFIGIYFIVNTWFNLLDIGINQAIGRQVANWSTDKTQHNALAQIIRSGETVLVLLAIFISIMCITQANAFVGLLNIDEPHTLTAYYSFLIFGPLFGLRFLISYFTAVINSFEDQVWLNCVIIAIWTAQYTTLAIGAYFTADVIWFFFLQLIWFIILLIILTKNIDRKLGGRVKNTPSRYYHKAFWKLVPFTFSIITANFFIMANYSFDKLLLSKKLPLAETGFLAILVLFISVTPLIVGILHTVFLPRLTTIFATNGIAGIKKVIGNASQLYIVLGLAVNIPLAIFSTEILDLLFHNNALTQWGAEPLKWYALGLVFFSISLSLSSLFVVFGKGKLYTYCNLINFIIFAPIMYIAVQKFGVMGASITFLVFNIAGAIIWPMLIMMLYLPGYYLTWVTKYATLPITSGIIGYIILTYIKEILYVENTLILFFEISAISGVLLLCLALSAKGIRAEIFILLRKFLPTS